MSHSTVVCPCNNTSTDGCVATEVVCGVRVWQWAYCEGVCLRVYLCVCECLRDVVLE